MLEQYEQRPYAVRLRLRFVLMLRWHFAPPPSASANLDEVDSFPATRQRTTFYIHYGNTLSMNNLWRIFEHLRSCKRVRMLHEFAQANTSRRDSLKGVAGSGLI